MGSNSKFLPIILLFAILCLVIGLLFYSSSNIFFRHPKNLAISPIVSPSSSVADNEVAKNFLLKGIASGNFNYGLGGQELGVIYLVPDQESLSITENPYCGAPSTGLIERHGTYSLILTKSGDTVGASGASRLFLQKISEIKLGELSWVSGTLHDGQIRLAKLNPPSREDFLLFYQYIDCNDEGLSIIRYDPQKQSLAFVPFGDNTKIFVFPSGAKITEDGHIVLNSYNNATGQTLVQNWYFDENSDRFVEKKN